MSSAYRDHDSGSATRQHRQHSTANALARTRHALRSAATTAQRRRPQTILDALYSDDTATTCARVMRAQPATTGSDDVRVAATTTRAQAAASTAAHAAGRRGDHNTAGRPGRPPTSGHAAAAKGCGVTPSGAGGPDGHLAGEHF